MIGQCQCTEGINSMRMDAEEALPLLSWDKEMSITIKSEKVHLYNYLCNDSFVEKKDETGIEEECLELFKSFRGLHFQLSTQPVSTGFKSWFLASLFWWLKSFPAELHQSFRI